MEYPGSPVTYVASSWQAINELCYRGTQGPGTHSVGNWASGGNSLYLDLHSTQRNGLRVYGPALLGRWRSR